MKVTVLTSNQVRHTALLEALARECDEVWAVRECTTVFPGKVEDFYRRSDVMRRYFARVISAEREVFGEPRFPPANVRQIPLRMGDLNDVDLRSLAPALQSDAYVVFGSSYIKGALIDHLVESNCFNIHMGTSPYYRGSSTNFWALFDQRPDYVGATIHMLSKGLDSGPMLFHAFPPSRADDPFVMGMRSVKAAQEALTSRLVDGSIWSYAPITQDKSMELRYTRNSDFTDEVVREYLGRVLGPEEIRNRLQARKLDDFLHPYIPAS